MLIIRSKKVPRFQMVGKERIRHPYKMAHGGDVQSAIGYEKNWWRIKVSWWSQWSVLLIFGSVGSVHYMGYLNSLGYNGFSDNVSFFSISMGLNWHDLVKKYFTHLKIWILANKHGVNHMFLTIIVKQRKHTQWRHPMLQCDQLLPMGSQLRSVTIELCSTWVQQNKCETNVWYTPS